MRLKSSQSSYLAFTLVELLVVIAIVALLSTLSVVALNTARTKARDSRRLSDVKNITTALEMYHINNNSYPPSPTPTGTPITNLCLSDAGITSTCEIITYLTKIPGDPLKNKHYLYSPVYNQYQVVHEEETVNCPKDWIRVPGNTLYNTNTFCVMKYEAKQGSDGLAESSSSGVPWVSISQVNARKACEDVDAHLITEDEWLTIVRNIEQQPSNWSGTGGVGDGSINRGNSGGASALPASDEGSGTTKRTHVLSNGEVIWDLAGNVWEWTDANILGKDQPNSPSSGTSFAYSQYYEIDNYGGLSPERLLPINSAWGTNQGYGRVYSINDPANNTSYAFYRGGRWGNGSSAGVLALSLNYGPSNTNTNIGFRCAR